jgi:hypothetical protein
MRKYLLKLKYSSRKSKSTETLPKSGFEENLKLKSIPGWISWAGDGEDWEGMGRWICRGGDGRVSVGWKRRAWWLDTGGRKEEQLGYEEVLYIMNAILTIKSGWTVTDNWAVQADTKTIVQIDL